MYLALRRIVIEAQQARINKGLVRSLNKKGFQASSFAGSLYLSDFSGLLYSVLFGNFVHIALSTDPKYKLSAEL